MQALPLIYFCLSISPKLENGLSKVPIAISGFVVSLLAFIDNKKMFLTVNVIPIFFLAEDPYSK